MAVISASWRFADGDECEVTLELENDYPDALHQGVQTCVSLLREVMVSGLVVQDSDDEDDT